MKTDRPLFSIVTAVYNGESTIRKTLQSIQSQKFNDFQYVVIDGGSKDRTLDIVNEYKSLVDVLVSEPDEGVSDAFNKGVQKAKGEYIIFLSADDYFLSSFTLEYVSSKIKENDFPDVVSGPVHKLIGDQILFSGNPSSLSTLKSDMTVNHWATFMKKNLFNEIGLFNRRYRLAMDYDIVLKLYLKNSSFFFCEQPITAVRCEGLSHKNYLSARREVREIQISNGISPLNAYFFYANSIFRHFAAELLVKCGFGFVTHFYRKFLSKNKKLVIKPH